MISLTGSCEVHAWLQGAFSHSRHRLVCVSRNNSRLNLLLLLSEFLILKFLNCVQDGRFRTIRRHDVFSIFSAALISDFLRELGCKNSNLRHTPKAGLAAENLTKIHLPPCFMVRNLPFFAHTFTFSILLWEYA